MSKLNELFSTDRLGMANHSSDSYPLHKRFDVCDKTVFLIFLKNTKLNQITMNTLKIIIRTVT